MDLAAKLLQHYIYITLKNNVIIKNKDLESKLI